jgi:hypothetical protein
MANHCSLPERQVKYAGKVRHNSRYVRYLGMATNNDVVRLNPGRFYPVKRSEPVVDELILVPGQRARLARRVLGKDRNDSVRVTRGRYGLCQSLDEAVEGRIAAYSNRNGQ